MACGLSGGREISLNGNRVKTMDHNFIAAVRRNHERLELFMSPSCIKVFNSNTTLNSYLGELGLEEIGLS